MVNVTITPLSGSLALDGSVGAAPTPTATTISYVWASGTNNDTLYYTDGTGTTQSLAMAGGGDINGSVTAGYIPYAPTTANTLANFTAGFAEGNSIYIGSNPSATTDDALNNTALGDDALKSITTGDANTMIGKNAGQLITSAGHNTGVGYYTLNSLTTGNYNIAMGYGAAKTMVGSYYNTAIGYEALMTNNAAAGDGFNTAIGSKAGSLATTNARYNVYVGSESGYSNTSGTGNTYVGYYAGRTDDGSHEVVAIGNQALADNATGSYNTIVGSKAAANATGIDSSVIIGRQAAGAAAATGDDNVIIGYRSAYDLTSAYDLATLGYEAGANITTGQGNTAIGKESLYMTTLGSENVAVGKLAGRNFAGGDPAAPTGLTGSFSVFVGYGAGYGCTGGTSYGNVIFVGHQGGYNATGANRVIGIGPSALVSGTNALDIVAIGGGAGSFADATGSVLIGEKAGYRPTGDYNVAVGMEALSGAAAGSDAYNNVAIGRQAGAGATSANNNVAIGYQAGYALTTPTYTTLIGAAAGKAITTGTPNTIVGGRAGQALTTGTYNTIVGQEAFKDATIATGNTALGHQAGQTVAGNFNTIIGTEAGQAATSMDNAVIIGRQAVGTGITTVDDVVAIGYRAGYELTEGQANTFVGYQAGKDATTGQYNTFIGQNVGRLCTTGNQNLGIGSQALYDLTTAGNSVAVGPWALSSVTTGSANVGLGVSAGTALTTGEGNICLGNESLKRATTVERNIAIGQCLLKLVDANGVAEAGDHNIAMGHYALGDEFVSGSANISIGKYSGYQFTSGSNNVIMGNSALRSGSGDNNIAIGADAAFKMGSGDATYIPTGNVAIGSGALYSLAGDNDNNIAIGIAAAYTLNDGAANIVLGYKAGYDLTTGDDNTLMGVMAGSGTTTASENVAIGHKALQGISTGGSNVAIGRESMRDIGDAGNHNVAVGQGSFVLGTSGRTGGVAIGSNAGYFSEGNDNTYVGYASGYGSTSVRTAHSNVAVGKEALNDITSGYGNVAVGMFAGTSLTTPRDNVLVGYGAGKDLTTGAENILIGLNSAQNMTDMNESVIIGQDCAASFVDQPTHGRMIYLGYRVAYNSTGSEKDYEIGMGFSTLHSDKSTAAHIAIGGWAGYYLSGTGDGSIMLGQNAFLGNSTGIEAVGSIAIGAGAGEGITASTYDIFLGGRAGATAGTTQSSVVIGFDAGRRLGNDHASSENIIIGRETAYYLGSDDGDGTGAAATGNTIIGVGAGMKAIGGDKNVILGYKAGPASGVDQDNKLYIHNAESDTPLIGGDFSTGVISFSSGSQNYASFEPTGSNGRLRINFNPNEDSSTLIYANNDASPNLHLTADAKIYFDADEEIIFDSAGAERMRLNSTGLGIGTTAPAYELDVQSNDPQIALTDANCSRFVLMSQSCNFYIHDYTSSNTGRFNIQYGGEVGIGDIVPTEKLDVDGNLRVRGGLTVEPSNPINIITQAIKNDISSDTALSTSYNRYFAQAVSGDGAGNVITRLTAPVDPSVGDEYFIVASTYHGAGVATESAQVTITADSGDTINKTAGAIEIAFTASTASPTTANYRTAHLICVEAATWAMTISDYGPTS